MKEVNLRQIAVILVISTLCLLLGCRRSDETGSFTFSFEADMDGWQPRGVDLDLGDRQIEWNIAPSLEIARDGSWSLRYFLANYNDKGKIWSERPFTLDPNREYAITIDFDFATADWGDYNHFTIIAGAASASPQGAVDLQYQDHTGTGTTGGVGYLWLEKHYESRARTDASGRLWVFVGIWGTWETPRTYYIDDLSVRFAPQ